MKSTNKMPTLSEQLDNIDRSGKIKISFIDYVIFSLIFLLGISIGLSW